MFLNDEYKKYKELADKFLESLSEGAQKTRAAHFFPRDSHGLVLPSKACCGLAELCLVMVSTLPSYGGVGCVEVCKKLGITSEEFPKIHLAHCLSVVAPSNYGVGLLFYCAREGYAWNKHLKSFGFVKIADFVNPIHDLHTVEMLACHGIGATTVMSLRKRIGEWAAGSSTKAA